MAYTAARREERAPLVSECLVSVIAPLRNDGDVVEAFVAEVMQVLRDNFTNYELVLVNDGSEDDTAERAADLLRRYECIRLVHLSRRFGADVAVASGLDLVIGDFAVVMHVAEDPPALIPELVRRAQSGKDLLLGVAPDRAGEPFWMRLGSAAFFWACRRVFKIPVIENGTQFWVLSRRVVNAVIRVDDKYRYLRLLGSYVGYKNETFTYQKIKRRARVRRRRPRSAVRLAIDILVANSLRPLRLASYLGLLASLANLAYMCWVAAIYVLKLHR